MAATITKAEVRHRKPFGGVFFWILAFFFVYYAVPMAWVPGMHLIHPAKLVGAGALIALLLNAGSFGEALLPEVVFILLLIAQMGLSSIFSPVWKGGAVHVTLTFAQVVLIVFAMALAVRTIDRLRKLVFVQTVSIAVIAVISLLSGGAKGRLTAALSSSNYSNSNDLALAIVLTIPFCFYFFFRAQGIFRKGAWALAMLAMCAAAVSTASRGGFLAFAVAGGMCLWEYGIKARRLILVFAAVVLGVMIFFIAGAKLRDRLAGTFNPNVNYESSYGSYKRRKNLLIDSLRYTAEYPLFGIGPGDFQSASKTWQPTHDVYTTFSAEVGLPALILFLLMYRRGFINLREVRRRMPDSELSTLAASMRASLLAFAVAGFFYPDAYAFFPYLMVALTTAAFQIARDQSVEIQEPESARQAARSYTYGMASRTPVSTR